MNPKPLEDQWTFIQTKVEALIGQKAGVLTADQKITMRHNALTLPRTMCIGRTTKFRSKTLTAGFTLEQVITVVATGFSSLAAGS